MTIVPASAVANPAFCLVDPASGGASKPAAAFSGVVPSLEDVRSAVFDFASAVGGNAVPVYDLSVTGDGSFRWNKDSNYIRHELVVSPASLRMKARNLLAEKRAAEKAAAAREAGEDDSYLASTWWAKFDTSVQHDEDGSFQFYEVSARDSLGRPTEITDCLTGEVVTKANFVNKKAIQDWSARSRFNMGEKINTLEFTDFGKWIVLPPLGKLRIGNKSYQLEGPRNAITTGQVGMVTLTLPADWVTVAPNGKAFKRLVRNFQKKWLRDVGEWRVLWKMEFQDRGAPHMHILTYIPPMVKGDAFEAWLSQAWADTVAHPDPEEYAKHLAAGTGVDFTEYMMTDPTDIIPYFVGYTAKTDKSKEYQHKVPEEWSAPGDGPGRFWGFAGFVVATESVEVQRRTKVLMEREMRKMIKSRAWKSAVRRELGQADRQNREPLPLPLIHGKKRRLTGLGRRGSQKGGTVLVKNAPHVARALGAWIRNTNLRYEY